MKLSITIHSNRKGTFKNTYQPIEPSIKFMHKVTRYFCWTGKWEGADFLQKEFPGVILQKIPKEQYPTACTATTGTKMT